MASHEIKIRVMKTVSDGTREIILGRAKKKELANIFDEHSALAMIHGDVCDIIYASDLAQKASGVEVFEIGGNCPQHLTCIGILGNASAVDAAVSRIREEFS